MITIIDYGAGNIKSIQNMLGKIGVDSCITSKEEEVKQADKIILPGVGHFDYGMRNLQESGLIEVLNQKVVKEKMPFLGICLGAQLLGLESEEGTAKGLGWIKMKVVKFDKSRMEEKLKIPQMGWNKVSNSLSLEQEESLSKEQEASQQQIEWRARGEEEARQQQFERRARGKGEKGNKYGRLLLEGLTEEARFYFVHSYHMLPENKTDILATTTYGYEFVSAVQHENIMGVQFHPEKSHVFGMQVMKNFAAL